MLNRFIITCALLVMAMQSHAAIVTGSIENQGADLTISQVFVVSDVTGQVTVDSVAGDYFEYLMAFDSNDAFLGSSLTSSISFNAVAGETYLLTVGLFSYSQADALAGLKQAVNLSPSDSGDWSLDITGATPVPVPAAFPLFLSALLGLGFLRKQQ